MLNFEKITESPETLAKWLICPYKHEKKCKRYENDCNACCARWLNEESEE